MTPKTPETDHPRELALQRTAWFSALVHSVRRGDAAEQRKSEDALADLGVRVDFDKPPRVEDPDRDLRVEFKSHWGGLGDELLEGLAELNLGDDRERQILNDVVARGGQIIGAAIRGARGDG